MKLMFLSVKISTYDENDALTIPLTFWKSNYSHFPKLAIIARSLYFIPESQNKSEQTFSTAGHMMIDLRTTLDMKHLDEPLLVRPFNKLKCLMDKQLQYV
jgi:hypothetical protein